MNRLNVENVHNKWETGSVGRFLRETLMKCPGVSELYLVLPAVDVLLASGGERRDAKRRFGRRKELPVTVIWENRTTS